MSIILLILLWVSLFSRCSPPEPPAAIRAEALAKGMLPEQLLMKPNPLEAARQALELAQDGDVLVLLAHIQRQEILQLVHEFIAQS